MKELLTRLHRLRMILTSLVLTVIGIALIALGQYGASNDVWGIVSFVPWNELGGIVVGAGILGIWIDYLFQKEENALSDHRLRRILADHAPLMRDAVLGAFAANSADLERVATPETLDNIVSNSLALRLGDDQFAHEIFRDIKNQAIDAGERWLDASLDINVTPHENPEYFDVSVRWEYKTVLGHAQRSFVCLSDRREYAELAQSHGETSAWYLKPDGQISARDRSAYELVQFAVDGVERKIKRASRKDYQAYSVDVGADVVEAAELVTVSYTYRLLTPRYRHLLFFDIEQPTRDMSVTFDYTGCEMFTVSAIDLIPSVRPTRIEHSPSEVSTKNLRVEIDGWVFPRSGIAFVWTLESEVNGARAQVCDRTHLSHE